MVTLSITNRSLQKIIINNYFMAVSNERLGDDRRAEWCFKRALKAGCVQTLEPYQQFKERAKQRRAEEKRLRKEANKRKRLKQD